MNQPEDIVQHYERLMAEQQAQASTQQWANAQQQIQLPEPDTNLVREQLDLGPELKRIDYLLRSYTLVVGPDGATKWQRPEDENMIILSDYGVHVFREILSWYINKNTLLSNYEEEMILTKMRRLSHCLNDLILLEYEKIFYIPSFEACKKELMRRLDAKAKIKNFASQLLGHEIKTEEIKQGLLAEMEGKLEEELAKIRDELFTVKLKRFEQILRCIQDAIHSTYNRAWNGQERRSLRQHMQITETKGNIGFGNPDMMNTQTKGGVLSMFRRR